MQLRLGVDHGHLWGVVHLREVGGRREKFRVARGRREEVRGGLDLRGLGGGRRGRRGGELHGLEACLQPLKRQRKVGQVQLPRFGEGGRDPRRLVGQRIGPR